MSERAPDLSYASLLTDPRLLTVIVVSFFGLFGPNAAAPALPGIAGALVVPEAEIGLVMSAFFLPAIVAVPAAGALADVYGRRPLVAMGLVLFGAAGVAIAFVDDFGMLLVLRAIQGVGFAGLSPLTITLVGDLYSGPEGSAAQGIRGGAHGVNQIAVPVLAGFLADLSWNYPFLLFALAFPTLLLVAYYLPETADLDTGEVAGRARLREELGDYWSAIRAEATDRDLAVLFGVAFVGFLVKSVVITFVPLFVVLVLGGSAFVAGVILSLTGVVRVVVSPLSGIVVARSSPTSALAAALGFAAAGVALFPLSPTNLVLGVVMGLYSIGDSLFVPILNDAVTSTASAGHRGGIVGGMNTVKQVANVTGPFVFGLVLSAFGFGALFWLAAALTLVYAVALATRLRPRVA